MAAESPHSDRAWDSPVTIVNNSTFFKTPSMHPLDPAWEAIRREFDTACNRSAQAARSQTTHQLNQALRRLRTYDGEAEWTAAILDAVCQFAGQAAVLVLKDGALHLRAQRNLGLPEDFTFAVSDAGAFATAIESKDPVIALRTTSEVTATLSSPDAHARAHLIPVVNGNRVAAIVFAANHDYVDVNALELIACMASIVVQRQANTALHIQIAPAPQGASPDLAPKDAVRHAPKALPSWTDLSPGQRMLHMQAQRFSRVKVAEMQLARPEACHAGREQRNLYLFLKNEIDKAREVYGTQFMTTPSMVDYLHLELVQTAAGGDENKLGADYPGQLV
jgi:hypothetical protein